MAEQTERQLQDALGDAYRVERELGAGGMGTVYLAEDLRHSRRVVIKVLRPDLVLRHLDSLLETLGAPASRRTATLPRILVSQPPEEP